MTESEFVSETSPLSDREMQLVEEAKQQAQAQGQASHVVTSAQDNGSGPRLTREAITDVQDVTEYEHYVPEWGGTVLLRSVSQRKMNEIMAQTDAAEERGEHTFGMMMRLVLKSGVVDPEVDDEFFELLLDKSASAVTGIFESIMDNSNLTEAARKRAEKSVSGKPD